MVNDVSARATVAAAGGGHRSPLVCPADCLLPALDTLCRVRAVPEHRRFVVDGQCAYCDAVRPAPSDVQRARIDTQDEERGRIRDGAPWRSPRRCPPEWESVHPLIITHQASPPSSLATA